MSSRAYRERQNNANKISVNPSLLTPYMDYPIEFVEDLIFKYYPVPPRPTLNRHEKDMFKAVVEHDWISIRSGRGRGKTTGVALLIPWFLMTRPMAQVIATAPKIDQLHDILWPAINKWLQFSPLRETLLWSKEKVEYADKRYSATWFAVSRTAKSKENLSGYHADYQMMIADEASGIADDILETIEQTQSQNPNQKEIKTILISNPTKVTGYFYKTQKLPEWQKFWKAIHFKPTEEEIAGDAGAQRTIKIHGIDHDISRVSVFGEFPSGNPQAVISYTEAWDAMNREIVHEGVIEIGADIARFGDDLTVFYYRYGYKIFPCLTFKKQSTVDTENAILALVRDLRRRFEYDRVIRIKIDDSTMGGGVSDHLSRNTIDGIEIVRCLFGGAGDEFYSNSASIMWADLKKVIGKLELPRDDLLLEEICGRNWDKSLDNRSRQRVESKDDFKKRIHRSPDRADALVLCVSNSQLQARLLPKLISLRSEVFQNRPVRFDYKLYKRAELFGSIWYEKNVKHSCLAVLWDKEEGRLTVFFEGSSRMEGPDDIVTALSNVCEMYNQECRTNIKPRNLVYYGNRAMFGLSDAAIEMTNIKDGPYLSWQKHMIGVNPNFFFDLNGAILKLNEMIDQNRIVILPDMPQLRLQLETWVLDNEKPDNENHALCLALCNIISMLVQTKRMMQKPKALIPYGVTITKGGAVIIGKGKDEFLGRIEKMLSEGHRGRMKYFLPKRVEPDILPANTIKYDRGVDLQP